MTQPRCHWSAAYLRRLVFLVLYGAVILKISSTAPFLPREIAFTAFKTHIKDNRFLMHFVFFSPVREMQQQRKWNVFQRTYSWWSKPWGPAGKARAVWNYAGFVWLSWQWRWELRSAEPSRQTFCLDKHTLKDGWEGIFRLFSLIYTDTKSVGLERQWEGKLKTTVSHIRV